MLKQNESFRNYKESIENDDENESFCAKLCNCLRSVVEGGNPRMKDQEMAEVQDTDRDDPEKFNGVAAKEQQNLNTETALNDRQKKYLKDFNEKGDDVKEMKEEDIKKLDGWAKFEK